MKPCGGYKKGSGTMALRNIRPIEDWQKILDRISDEFPIHAMLGDADGRVLLDGGHYNPLCRRVRKDRESLTFVCSQTNSRMFHIARHREQPYDDFCEIGLFKTVVPVFSDGLFVGGLSACGVAVIDEPPEDFLVAKMLGIDEAEANRLIEAVPILDRSEAQRMTERFLKLLGMDRINPT
jgi:ligand-binding sensor protein